MTSLSTHVLDTHLGKPAADLAVTLFRRAVDGALLALASMSTDEDGRIPELAPAGELSPGDYTLRFETAAYFEAVGTKGFYPHVEVTFQITEASHYHVPLLLSPFGYSTYRGS